MRAINIITLILVIVGGINWGLIGIAQFDLVAAIFGGQGVAISRIVYALVGISAVWQLIPPVRSFSSGERGAQRTIALDDDCANTQTSSERTSGMRAPSDKSAPELSF